MLWGDARDARRGRRIRRPVPIELTPNFPVDADTVLLTESAAHDREIVARIKRQLAGGKNVVITSGLLKALQGAGIEDIAEIEYTGRIPDNLGDLYDLPRPAITAVRSYVQGNFPLRIDAPDHVSLFAYDNSTFILQSYRDTATDITVFVAGAGRRLMNDDTTVTGEPSASRAGEPAMTAFKVRIPAHSFQLFSYQ